jgi:hypothetical protein
MVSVLVLYNQHPVVCTSGHLIPKYLTVALGLSQSNALYMYLLKSLIKTRLVDFKEATPDTILVDLYARSSWA